MINFSKIGVYNLYFFLYIKRVQKFAMRNLKTKKRKEDKIMKFGQFESEFNFIRATRNEGISAKSGKPYDFATLVVADQFESFDLDIEPTLVPTLINIQKGDKIAVTLTIGKNFGNTTYQVTKVKSHVTVK